MATGTTTITNSYTKDAVRVIDYCDAPVWMHGDSLILRGYRREQNSFQRCYQSLWYLHNESVNIWSHLSIGIFFSFLALREAVLSLHDRSNPAMSDFWALQTFLIGATLCLFFSSFYHCVNCHSELVARRFLKADYLGIVFNITSTSISAAYVGLSDEQWIARCYITVILICGLTAFWIVLDPHMDGPETAKWRVGVFVALGASGVVPIIHAVLSPNLSLRGFPLMHIFASSVLYLSGAAIYVTRIPERYWPGVFDIWGASHQIFHVVVNMAQIIYFLGLQKALTEYRRG